ncbi:MAG TPA: hypothetical protein VLB84_18125 [Bacteroidia bacterium]|nr:hypothetical protein [Bacteroidia bacterium]
MKTTTLLLNIFLLFLSSIHAQNGKNSINAEPKTSQATTGTVYLNLSLTARGPGYIDVPVTFFSTDSIVSLDIALKFNKTVLSFQSINSPAPYLTDYLAKYSPDDSTLRFTSNSFQNYKINKTIIILRFNTLKEKVMQADFFDLIGYLNGDKVNMELKGNFMFSYGSLKFWLDDSPIQYDLNDPDHYLITSIYGTDSNCSVKSVIAIQPNMDGEFTYNNGNGSSIKIERDILASTDVQPVINGFDVSLGHKVLVKDTSFIPNVYQMIALDVNTDGIISAGDISQINQRSVKTITEFKQKWNYNNDGTSNGELSKDWIFVDSIQLSGSAYQLSVTYPDNDHTGYSKNNVPLVPFCLTAPQVNGEKKDYTGILLGDANGNYSSILNDGKIKRQKVK